MVSLCACSMGAAGCWALTSPPPTGTAIPELLTAILQLMPLDPAVAAPCFTMGMMKEHIDAGWKAPVKEEYKRLAAAATGAPVAFAEVRGACVWHAVSWCCGRSGKSATVALRCELYLRCLSSFALSFRAGDNALRRLSALPFTNRRRRPTPLWPRARRRFTVTCVRSVVCAEVPLPCFAAAAVHSRLPPRARSAAHS